MGVGRGRGTAEPTPGRPGPRWSDGTRAQSTRALSREGGALGRRRGDTARRGAGAAIGGGCGRAGLPRTGRVRQQLRLPGGRRRNGGRSRQGVVGERPFLRPEALGCGRYDTRVLHERPAPPANGRGGARLAPRPPRAARPMGRRGEGRAGLGARWEAPRHQMQGRVARAAVEAGAGREQQQQRLREPELEPKLEPQQ